MKRTSNNFVTRIDRSKRDDMERLNDIREAVKCINANCKRGSRYRLFRVDVKPRKPINKDSGYGGYGYGGNVLGGIENAQFLDVYIRRVGYDSNFWR